MTLGNHNGTDGQTDGQCEKRRARQTWCEVVVARSWSMRMIVGEDAVYWHSLSERVVLCLADFSELTTLWFVVRLK